MVQPSPLPAPASLVPVIDAWFGVVDVWVSACRSLVTHALAAPEHGPLTLVPAMSPEQAGRHAADETAPA